jgi:hypothetical protein
MTASYSFTAPANFLGLKPFFIADSAAAQSPLLFDFLEGLESLRAQELDFAQRSAALDQKLLELRQSLSPRLIHFYQLINQAHTVNLTVDNAVYDLELWWPHSLPGAQSPSDFAKPCCGVFLLRDQAAQIYVRVGYQPSVLLVNARDGALPVAAIVHEAVKQPLTEKITAVNITAYADPEAGNPLTPRLHYIKGSTPDENAQLNEPLKQIREVLAGRMPMPADFADNLAWLLALPEGAAQLRMRAREGR